MKKVLLFAVLLIGLASASCKKENPTPISQPAQNVESTLVVEIESWDMTSTDYVSILHGIQDHTTIKSIDVIIYSDLMTSYPLYTGGSYQLSDTKIDLVRHAGGAFDGNEFFNDSTVNRGYIFIHF